MDVCHGCERLPWLQWEGVVVLVLPLERGLTGPWLVDVLSVSMMLLANWEVLFKPPVEEK